jgi:hypothetical protein
MIPRIYGGAERRPGLYYVTSSYGTAQIARMITFVAPLDYDYNLEFGNKYIRAFYTDEVITTISSPYTNDDLFQIQYTQVGDVMWLVHADYPQMKLSRTSATAFSLDEIPFLNGPFLLRNDLIDPNEADSATMTCSVTAVGDSGTLTCTGEVFDDPDHVGAIFKLIHPRTNTIVSLSGVGTSSALDVKGTFSFNTHGTWTGTIKLQRRENSTDDNDWEDYRTYPGKGDRNVQFSSTEDSDNVEYRISSDASGTSCDITVNESTQEGIVQIDSVETSVSATVTVITEIASTNATKRWAEGAWSDYRGYPSSVTFFGDRCVYGGQADVMNADEQIITLEDPLIVHILAEWSGGQTYLSAQGLTDVGDGTWSEDYQTTPSTTGARNVKSDGTYIYYTENNVLYKINRDFTAVTDWQNNGQRALASLDETILAVDKNEGNVFVEYTPLGSTGSLELMDSYGNQLWIVTEAGTYTLYDARKSSFTAKGRPIYGRTPSGTAGSIYRCSGVMLSKTTGEVLARYNTGGTTSGTCYDIKENPINGDIIIAAMYSSLRYLTCYDPAGGTLTDAKWSVSLTTSANGVQFVYCSPYGDIYIGLQNESFIPYIYKYDKDGNFIKSYRTGIGSDSCYTMTQRDLDSIVVGCSMASLDSMNEDGGEGQIQIFDLDLNYLRSYDYGGYGSTQKYATESAFMLGV